MIIKEARLRAGLQDWDQRNRLMRELNLAEGQKKQAKWCLAFLLGEKSAYRKISVHSPFPVPRDHLSTIQYLVISLDRLINNLSVQEFDGTNNPFTLRKLEDIRFKVLNYFNHHFELGTEDVTMIREIIRIINAGLVNLGVHPNTKQMIANLLESIDLSTSRYLIDTIYPQDSTKTYPHYPALIQIGSSLKRRGMELIMKSNNNHWLLDPSNQLDKTYDFQTQYLESSDGTTIEGLWVKKKGEKKKTVVLALVGHFQTEHSYLVNDFSRFYDLFNTDIIFLNPRNYSQHAGVKATCIDDIVGDVVDYANFANKKYKHIILYGMCGGAPFMTLAAEQLEKKDRSYKVILDRTADSYSTFFKNTLQRTLEMDSAKDKTSIKKELERYIKPLTYMPNFSFNLFLSLSLSAFSILRQSLIMYLGLNFSLANRLKAIPAEKRLMLQAKSKKIPGKKEPEYTDIIVHPDDDMRHAFKETRHQKRIILKALTASCLSIAIKIPHEKSIHKQFMLLSEIFTACLHAIDNEKLKWPSSSDVRVGNDLHTEKLFTLKTRNETPIEQFIQAFSMFQSPRRKSVVRLHKKTLHQIYYSANLNLPDFDFTRDMAKEIKQIFDTVYDNRDFILPLAERICVGSQYDLDAVIKSLDKILETPEVNPDIYAAIHA